MPSAHSGFKTAAGRMVGAAQRLDEVGSTWPVAADVKCDAVDCDGVPGEWSLVPGSDPSRVLLYFHGGGYCSGSIVSHRRHGDGSRTRGAHARRSRSITGARPNIPTRPPMRTRSRRGASCASRASAAEDIAVGGDSAGGNLTLGLINRLRAAGEDLPACAWLVSPWTDLTMSGATLATQGCRRSADPQGLSRPSSRKPMRRIRSTEGIR